MLSGVVDLLWHLWVRGYGEALPGRRKPWPVGAALGATVFGGLCGGLASWAWPSRLTPIGPLPGASLLLVPITNGFLMHALGVWQEQRGRSLTFGATFWGGALFGLGFSVVRFALVANP